MWMGVGKLSIGVMQKIHYHNKTKGFMAQGGSIDLHGQGKDTGVGNEFFGWAFTLSHIDLNRSLKCLTTLKLVNPNPNNAFLRLNLCQDCLFCFGIFHVSTSILV
jgi:hypothetical protein